ncbi:MAG: hypothetical protein PVF28_05550 [Thioalkalispiraceae bacterium]|jgi:hypothetical protein
MNRSNIFAAVFLITAFLLALWMVNRVPHYVTLHLNDRWHVMLIGEKDTNTIQFDANEFQLIRENQGNLWLTGKGKITWRTHNITVQTTGIHLNNHSIETDINTAEVNVMFYPDGRVTKGNIKLK